MSQLWSWALAVVGIVGIWLAGRNKKSGWAVGLGAQVLWLAYAIVTRQWGFLVTAVAYAAIYGRNWLRWHRAEAEKDAGSDGPADETAPQPDYMTGETVRWLRDRGGGGQVGDR